MLFNFNLTPVENVQPWGEPSNLVLHWFGLTDGQYWMEAGRDSLFEYSEHARQHLGTTQYCDYQVVRLYEDVLEMVPFILEPVPPPLVPYISGDSGRAWKTKLDTILENLDDGPDLTRLWDATTASISWTWSREMTTNYLTPSTDISIWSDESQVHIEWDNRNKMEEGVHAWSAILGTFSLPRAQFIVEIQSFHSRLMEQMSERVKSVAAGALNPDISVDLPGLRREHEFRCLSLDRTRATSIPATDWRAVHEAIQEVERMTQGYAD